MHSLDHIYLLAMKGIHEDYREETQPEKRKDMLQWGYDNLKEFTGQDFGFDVVRWENWLSENKHSLITDEEREETAAEILRYISILNNDVRL